MPERIAPPVKIERIPRDDIATLSLSLCIDLSLPDNLSDHVRRIRFFSLTVVSERGSKRTRAREGILFLGAGVYPGALSRIWYPLTRNNQLVVPRVGLRERPATATYRVSTLTCIIG